MSDVVVAKFGGSSLSDSNQFKKVRDIVFEDGRRKYIVPSAPGKRYSEDFKITDLLYLCYEKANEDKSIDESFILIEQRYADLCKNLKIMIDISKYLSIIKKEIVNGSSMDYVASRGEYLNAIILAEYLEFEFIDAVDIIFFDINGLLDENTTYAAVKNRLSKAQRAVIPGFYGSSPDGRIKTFSRGGSDITGAIIARSISAEIYENWTDVSGLLMADPRIVKNPRPIEAVTYKELRELSYMGANVFHQDAVFPVINNGIPINIKNTNKPEDRGTLIVSDDSDSRIGCITGISGKRDFTVITIEKSLMNKKKGYCQSVLSILESNNISYEYIPSGVDSISLVVAASESKDKIKKILAEIKKQCNPDCIDVDDNIALIAVVAKGMAKTPGIIAKVLSALSKCNLNIRMVNQGVSGLSIIIGIENENFEDAINAIYYSFENNIVLA